jgi:hypothetical protein
MHDSSTLRHQQLVRIDAMHATIRGLLLPLDQLSLRRESIMILLILAESMVIYIYAGFLLATYDRPFHPLPVLLIFALLLLAYQVPHLLETLRIWSPRYEIVMTVALLLSMLVVIKAGAFPTTASLSLAWLERAGEALALRGGDPVRSVWGLFALTVYAWWRGRTRADATLDAAYTMLRWGILLATTGVVLAWLAAPPGARILETSSAALVGYLVCVLLAIALARQPVLPEANSPQPGWVWAAVFVLPVLAIVLTTVSTAGLLTRDLLDLLVSIVEPLIWLVSIVIRSLILVIALVAFVILAPLLWLLERHDFGPLSGLPRLDIAPRTGNEFRDLSQTVLDIGDPLRYLVVGVITIGVIWLLVRFAFKRRKYWHDQSNLQRTSLIQWQHGSRSLLMRASAWLRSRFGGDPDAGLPAGAEWVNTRRIRRAYRRFLGITRDHGLERQSWQTPAAFASEIRVREPDLADDVDTLTRLYNGTRYSGKPADERSANDSEDALDAINNQFRESTSPVSTLRYTEHDRGSEVAGFASRSHSRMHDDGM